MNFARRRLSLALNFLTIASAVLAVGALGACGGDDGGPATPTLGPTSAAPKSGPGTITVTSSSPIAGQNGKLLFVNAAPQAGGPATAEACVQIKSDRFAVPATVMTDKKGDPAPCTGPAGKTMFPEGTYTVTAGIYAPPAQAPDKEVKLTVQVKGDVTIQVDGAALSR